MNETFFIVADDFTGSNDSGVQIAKRGIPIRVVLDAKGISDNGMSFVLDTESRNIDSSSAFQIVTSQLTCMKHIPFDHLIKKVDSTIRGNIGPELAATSQILQPDIIIFAPAFPETGRTTVNGVQLLNGVPICKTELADDPIKPVTEDYLPNILKEAFDEPIHLYSLDELRSGNLKKISGCRIFCFDIQTPDDMDLMVRSVRFWGKKILWSGSAGIVNSLIRQTIHHAPVLAVVGSISETSRQQLYACKAAGIPVLPIQTEALLRGADWKDLANQAVQTLQQNKDLVITTSYSRNDYTSAVDTGIEMGMSKEEVSAYTRNLLADLILYIGKRVSLGGLFLTGGDTAIGFIQKSGATGSTICREIMPGVPLMQVNGGIFDNMYLITKAGAFGAQNTIIQSINSLKEC